MGGGTGQPQGHGCSGQNTPVAQRMGGLQGSLFFEQNVEYDNFSF